MHVHLGLDVGKTNLRVGVFDTELKLIDRQCASTSDVGVAQRWLVETLVDLSARFEIQSTGISIFGPLQVDAGKPDYGALIALCSVRRYDLMRTLLRPVAVDPLVAKHGFSFLAASLKSCTSTSTPPRPDRP